MNVISAVNDTQSHTELPKQSPWKRYRDEVVLRPSHKLRATMNNMTEEFSTYKYANMDLNIRTKRAALKVSTSVVGLISGPRTGGEALFHASGTICECSENVDGKYVSTIVTSASLLRSSDEDLDIKVYTATEDIFDGTIVGCDLHYNLAIISIISDVSLPVAKLRPLDDSVSIDPELCHSSQALRPHSRAFKICAEDMVIALGRSCINFSIMVAPGQFSLDECGYDCRELLMATCKITKPGVGGPLINYYGEVIRVNFMNEEYTPFLAVNIVEKWLNHFKQYGKFCRPWIGVMSWTNLYAEKVEELECILLQNPDVTRGVLLEAVAVDSPADRAGLQAHDVIVQCNGKSITSLLKFCRKILDKAGKSVEVGVIRTDSDSIVKLNLDVEEFRPEKFHGWPLPKERTICIKKYRRPG